MRRSCLRHPKSSNIDLRCPTRRGLNLGAEEEAVALFRRSIENNRTIPLTHFFLAATLANLGKLEEARAEAKAGLALDPGFSIRRFRSGGQAGEFLIEGMRKAGVPEG